MGVIRWNRLGTAADDDNGGWTPGVTTQTDLSTSHHKLCIEEFIQNSKYDIFGDYHNSFNLYTNAFYLDFMYSIF